MSGFQGNTVFLNSFDSGSSRFFGASRAKTVLVAVGSESTPKKSTLRDKARSSSSPTSLGLRNCIFLYPLLVVTAVMFESAETTAHSRIRGTGTRLDSSRTCAT